MKTKSNGGWGTRLVHITKTLKLEDSPDMAELIRKVLISGNEAAARKLVRLLEPDYFRQSVTPDPFLSRCQGFNGRVPFGASGNGRFGLDWNDFSMHVLVAGQSGSGKTTLLRNIVFQALKDRVHVVHFDRKRDLEFAVRHGVLSIGWRDLRLNPLRPPAASDVEEYRNDQVKAFCEQMQFMQRGTSIFLHGLDQLLRAFRVYEQWPSVDRFPSMFDLLRLFKSSSFAKTVKGHGRQSLYSIIDKLESMLIELKPIVACQQGFDIAKLYRQGRVVNLVVDGLSVEYQNFLITACLLQYSHFFKAHGPRGGLNMLIMFDEAKGIVGKAMNSSFLVKDLVSKVRELGIGLVCADQIPSEIAQFFFSNIGTLVQFRVSDGNDLQRLRYSSGARPEQAAENYALAPGEAVVRSIKTKDLLRIRVPFRPVEKFIARDEIRRLMKPYLEVLFLDVVPLKDVREEPGLDVDEAEMRMLRCLAKDYDRPSSQVYEGLGFSPSAGHRIKERLRKKKYVSQVRTNLGKGGRKAVFIVPNPVVLEKFGIALGPGRGGPLHKHFQSTLKTGCEGLGYKAVIEESVGHEAPDLGLEKDEERVAVEICVTSKPKDEAENAGKAFRLGYDRVVLSFVNTHVMNKTKELATQKCSPKELERVRFCLVHRVLEEL